MFAYPPRGRPTNNVANRLRINREIRAKEVRLIGADGSQVGVVPIREALEMAQAAQLDLVEVAPEAKPPVCKIEDFAKIMYQKKRQMREARKRQKAVELKEVKIRPNCDPHDFGIKMNRGLLFLGKGMKVKITMMFRGREIATARERAEMIRQRVMQAVTDYAEIESMSRTTTKIMTMILAPTRKAIQEYQAKVAKLKRESGMAEKAKRIAAKAADGQAPDEEDLLEDELEDMEDDLEDDDDDDLEDEDDDEGDSDDADDDGEDTVDEAEAGGNADEAPKAAETPAEEPRP